MLKLGVGMSDLGLGLKVGYRDSRRLKAIMCDKFKLAQAGFGPQTANHSAKLISS